MEWDFEGFCVVDLTSIGFDIKATKSCQNLLSQHRTKKYSLFKITGAYYQIQQPQLPITLLDNPAILLSCIALFRFSCPKTNVFFSLISN